MKFQSILLSVFLFTFLLSACKKGNDITINNNNNNNNSNSNNNNISDDSNRVLQLASVQFDVQGETQKLSFFYNSTGQINKVSSEKWLAQADSTNSKPYYTIDAEWSADHSLLRVINTMAGSQSPHTLEFLKDSVHQLVRKGQYPITAAFGPETWLGFDSKGRIIADSNYAGDISDYKLFTWDANDNLVKIESYLSNNDGTYTRNYFLDCTYDQKKNPFYSTAPYFFALTVAEYYQYQSKHNLLQVNTTFNGSTTVMNAYTYEYNAQGYPTKRVITSPSSTDPYIVTYTYK